MGAVSSARSLLAETREAIAHYPWKARVDHSTAPVDD